MDSKEGVAKKLGALLAVAALGATLVLASCAASQGDLPASHVNGNGEVDWGHARCGACHMNGNRVEVGA